MLYVDKYPINNDCDVLVFFPVDTQIPLEVKFKSRIQHVKYSKTFILCKSSVSWGERNRLLKSGLAVEKDFIDYDHDLRKGIPVQFNLL